MSNIAIPDARSDFAGTLNFMVQEILSLKKEVAFLKRNSKESDSITISDILSDQHVSRSLLEKSPWRIPNWGRPDFGERPKRWRKETYIQWMETPEDERRAQWDAMGMAERRKARGI